MGGRAMNIVVPMALGAMTGGFGSAVAGQGLVGNVGGTLFNLAADTALTTMQGAITGALIGGVGAGAMQMMTPDLPAQPD